MNKSINNPEKELWKGQNYCDTPIYLEKWVNEQETWVSNRPFYSCVLGCLAFEWKCGWSWPCFDRNLTPFHMQIPTN